MRIACELISQGMRHRFDDVRGWAKAVSLWITDVQVDDPATGPLQCFRGTNKVTNSVMKIYGSIGRRDHSQFLAKVLVQFECLKNVRFIPRVQIRAASCRTRGSNE